jgi:hypothetical protein
MGRPALAGRFAFRDSMGMADVPALLSRADARGTLPRLGGMARPDGVVIASDRFWAYAHVDGTVREGMMPRPPELLSRLPLVRGLVRLGSAMAPLFGGTGVARRGERLVLALALVVPFGFVFMPHRVGLVAGLAITAALVGWLFRGRTRGLHGAEHRAIAAVEERRLVATWGGEARPTRFARRCGTNFAALALPMAVLADRVWPLPATLLSPVLVAVLSLALTMEVWRAVQSSERLLARALLLPGLALQRLTTGEPCHDETRVALAAAASVLRRELEA